MVTGKKSDAKSRGLEGTGEEDSEETDWVRVAVKFEGDRDWEPDRVGISLAEGGLSNRYDFFPKISNGSKCA